MLTVRPHCRFTASEGEGRSGGASSACWRLLACATAALQSQRSNAMGKPRCLCLLQYKLGRNPQCEFQLLDQEVSSKHAVLKWSAAQRAWKLVRASTPRHACMHRCVRVPQRATCTGPSKRQACNRARLDAFQ